MKRFIFAIPKQQVLVCAIKAADEADARERLDSGECEHLYTKAGTTVSGKIELMNVYDIPTEGEPNEESN